MTSACSAGRLIEGATNPRLLLAGDDLALGRRAGVDVADRFGLGEAAAQPAAAVDAEVAADGEDPGGDGAGLGVEPLGLAPDGEHGVLDQVVTVAGAEALSGQEGSEAGRVVGEQAGKGLPVAPRGRWQRQGAPPRRRRTAEPPRRPVSWN